MKDPLAVLRKRALETEVDSPAYDVVSIVTEKYVFTTRPMPVLRDEHKAGIAKKLKAE